MKDETKYTATHIVHWSTGPTPCCVLHADGLVMLGNMLGIHVPFTINTDPDVECTNCVNEAKADHASMNC